MTVCNSHGPLFSHSCIFKSRIPFLALDLKKSYKCHDNLRLCQLSGGGEWGCYLLPNVFLIALKGWCEKNKCLTTIKMGVGAQTDLHGQGNRVEQDEQKHEVLKGSRVHSGPHAVLMWILGDVSAEWLGFEGIFYTLALHNGIGHE